MRDVKKSSKVCARDHRSRDLEVFLFRRRRDSFRTCSMCSRQIVAQVSKRDIVEPECKSTIASLDAKRTIEQTVQTNSNLGRHIRH